MKKEDKKQPETSGGPNLWMLVTIVIGIAFIGLLAVYLTNPPSPEKTPVVPIATCSATMTDYINTNLVQPGTKVTLLSTAEKNGLYEVITSYQGNNITVFTSKDCHLLFLEYVDITAPTPTTTTPTPTPTIVKSEKPTVDLYVMAFCPYGVQAENSMKPVVDLLGNKADIHVRFIASVRGSDLASVSSLHGINEGTEDVRQLCIMKKYPAKFWEYLMATNQKCYPVYSNSSALDACWSTAAADLGINTTEIAACVNDGEGLTLLKSDESLVQKNGVTGSPTLFINGIRYSGARTPEGFKQAICNAFVTAPAVCSVALNSTTTPASGSCV
ncbi:MAG: thioredoxin domain-containing protein [Methanomicrobiales archaeon]|nr:thioredoxin domain-containing protein [Methanomicrobiales archaeon]